MSSLAYAPDAVPTRAGARSLARVFSDRGSDVLLAVAMLALGAGLIAYLPGAFSVDTWLALATGRDVWQSGLPHHETLTALSHGAVWIDQQWLSQLASYGLYRLGGFALLGIINVGLMVLGVAGAVVAARRLGAEARAVMLALPVCIWLLIPSREVRTQAFVIPLFLATVYLLARDSRTPSRRVYWCLPILVLWANLHGTVSLGVLLVGLRGVTLAWERRSLLSYSLRAWRRPLVLAVAAPACLLTTPYGLSVVSYFQTMFLGSTVRHAVTEWQPITSAMLMAVPFFVIAAVALWSFGRSPSRTSLWEKLALIALAAGSISVIRNVLFFALAALVILPLSFDLPARKERGKSLTGTPDRARLRLNAAITIAAAAALLMTSAATFVQPASKVEFAYQRVGVLEAVQRATHNDPSLKVVADVRFADWLLWRDPALSGRIANDARFELLSPVQTAQLQSLFGALGTNWKQGAHGFRLVVLDRRYAPDTAQGLLAEPGRRVLYDDGDRLVILRSASQAN